MMFMTIPAASIAGMVFSLIVSFALPIGLFVYAKKKLGAKTAPFFIGCGVFFVMVVSWKLPSIASCSGWPEKR